MHRSLTVHLPKHNRSVKIVSSCIFLHTRQIAQVLVIFSLHTAFEKPSYHKSPRRRAGLNRPNFRRVLARFWLTFVYLLEWAVCTCTLRPGWNNVSRLKRGSTRVLCHTNILTGRVGSCAPQNRPRNTGQLCRINTMCTSPRVAAPVRHSTPKSPWLGSRSTHELSREATPRRRPTSC